MSAKFIFELAKIPGDITEGSMKTTIENMGEKTWFSHETVLPEEVRPEVAIRVRIDKVSFFILKKWETYAIGEDIPTCIKKSHELLQNIRDKIGIPEITLQEIKIEYSKTQGILLYVLPYLTWFIGLFLGKIGTLSIWVLITMIYIIIAIIVEGKEQIYSWLLLRYYDHRG